MDATFLQVILHVIVMVAGVTSYMGDPAVAGYNGQTHKRHVIDEVDPADVEAELRQHSEIFEQRIVTVTENIHVAIGYAIANTIMIDAPRGLIIVDTTETIETGREILAEFRKISQKPIEAIVYTHQHADHTWGAEAFIEDPEKPPQVWAHEYTARAMATFFTTGSAARLKRSFRMLGTGLVNTPYEPINDGIGIRPGLNGTGGRTVGPVHPTKFLRSDRKRINIAGLSMTLYHIPGETADQLGLWIPRDKAFLCGDDLYRAFPNIYTIRGAAARDAVDWFTSIDLMIDLDPEHLVPSHTPPISGKQQVLDVIVPYRDGIQYVHDQTVRLMNKGMTPDDIAHTIRLPDQLRLHPYLREVYGNVFWSVKGIFDKYLGWFSGDAVDLYPLQSDEKAHLMAELAGGVGRLVRESQKALQDNRFQWALELSAHALKVDNTNADARDVKFAALTSLGAKHLSTNARNYYFTVALEESLGDTGQTINVVTTNVVKFLSIEDIFVVIRLRYRPEICGDMDTVVVFDFLDEGKVISVKLRNGVAVVRHELLPVYDIRVSTTVAVWKQVLIDNTMIMGAIQAGSISIEGGVANFLPPASCSVLPNKPFTAVLQ